MEQSKLAVAAKLGEISTWKEKLGVLQKEFEESASHRQSLESREQERVNSLNVVTQQIATSKSELVTHRCVLDSANRHEYKLLKSLVDSLEGYPESIKYLKKHKNWHRCLTFWCTQL